MSTRRDFLKGAGLLIGAAAGSRGLSLLHDIGPSVSLQVFPYDAVELADGPAREQWQETHNVLMNVSEDSLLRPFRVREGLPAPGAEMGGWYSTWAFAPAHAFGQWIAALSRSYAITGDAATRDKVYRLVHAYASTVEPSGKFYRDNRFPAYTYDKLIFGLLAAYTLTDCREALPTLARTTAAALPYLPPRAVPRRETPVLHGEDITEHCWDESYTIPENLFHAEAITGDRRYRELAKRFLMDRELFDPLAAGDNVLPGKHAYSHVNALGSAAMAYRVLGDPKYFRAAQNGFRFVQEQSFATGGWGPDEHFVPPNSGKLGESLLHESHSFETPCGSYAHFKIAQHLLTLTREPHYGDSMEQVLYNTVLGALPLQPDGRAFYYSDYRFGARKGYHPDAWPCCSGTLPLVAASYGSYIYLSDEEGPYVNLYLPSSLRWQQHGAHLRLTQSGEYPEKSDVLLTISASEPTEFSLRLRIPAWAEGARVRVNNERTVSVQAGTFATLRRTWRNGDNVELEMPLSLRLTPVDQQHPNVVALSRGPLVLCGVGNTSDRLARGALLSTSAAPNHGFVARSGVRLASFATIKDEAYSTYLQLLES
jgi:uncharacterized protein